MDVRPSVEPAQPLQVPLLLALARADLTGERGVLERLLREVEWPAVLRAVERHGLTAALGRQLTLNPALGEPEQRAAVEQLAGARVHANFTRAIALSDVVEQLSAAAIPALALKGPALAMLLYRDVGARAFGDIDVLVQESDLTRAIAVLRSTGWRRDPADHGWNGLHHVRLLWPSTKLELHWRPLPFLTSNMLDWKDLWSSRVEVTLAGRSVATPGGAALLLYLAIHGALHRWIRVEWMLDFARWWKLLPAPAQAEARFLARDRGLVFALAVAKLTCASMLGIGGAEGEATEPTRAAREVGRVGHWLHQERRNSLLPPGPVLLWERSQLWDRWPDRLRTLSQALELTNVERGLLPKFLAESPVGWLVRCGRLGYRWGRHTVGVLRRRLLAGKR